MPLAIGPASRPPVAATSAVDWTLVSTTDTAYCGSSAGANAMIQACEQVGIRRIAELRRAGLGRHRDPSVQGDAAARRAAFGDADHQLTLDLGGLRRDRGLPHRGARLVEHAARPGRRSTRRRTASSSGRRWRPPRPPSPCAAAPSAPRSGRSRGWRAAGAPGRGCRCCRRCWRSGRAGRSATARRCPTLRCRRPSPRARAASPAGRTGCCSCGRTPSARSPPQRLPL